MSDKDTSLREDTGPTTIPVDVREGSDALRESLQLPERPQKFQHDGRTHCCECYQKAVGYDYDELRSKEKKEVADLAAELVCQDTGKIDADVRALAEKVLSRYLEPQLPRFS